MEKERKIQERTLVSRKKILDAAIELFRTKGYYNTNTKEIAKLAGVAIGSFYNYYPDKLSVYREIIMEHINQNYKDLEEMLKEVLENPNLAKEKLTKYVKDGMISAYEVMSVFRDFDSIAVANTDLRDIVNDMNSKIMNVIYEYIKEMPTIKKRANPIIMAQMVFFLVQGISDFISALPNDMDKSEHEQQLAEMAYWYLFGEE